MSSKMTEQVLDDALIRDALRKQLHQQYGVGYTFDEVGMATRNVRLDVLQFANGLLIGYEIKSDADDLKRLPNQVASYPAMTDLNYLVVGDVLHDEAIKLLPDNWGIMRARLVNGVVNLKVERVAMLNSQLTFDELLSHCRLPAIKKQIGALLPKPMRPSFRKLIKLQMGAEIQKYIAQGILDKNQVRQFMVTEFYNNLSSYKPDHI